MAQSSTNIDILHGSLWRDIPLFALPVAITGILEQLSNLIDTLMIGHFSPDGGTLGMAAVGSTTPIATLLIMLFVGLSLGANVTIAHAVGAGDRERANRCAHRRRPRASWRRCDHPDGGREPTGFAMPERAARDL